MVRTYVLEKNGEVESPLEVLEPKQSRRKVLEFDERKLFKEARWWERASEDLGESRTE